MKQQKVITESAGSKSMMVIGVVLCVILIPVLIASLTLIVKSFVYPDKIPGSLGYKPLIILSDFMNPDFYSGDLVLVKEVATDSLQTGDIIAYKEDETVIIHRIQEIIEVDGVRQFVAKGDNNNLAEGIVITDHMIEGQYFLHIPKLGNVAMFLQTPIGLILFVACPLLLFVLYDVLHRRKSVYKKNTILQLEAERESRKMMSGEKITGKMYKQM